MKTEEDLNNNWKNLRSSFRSFIKGKEKKSIHSKDQMTSIIRATRNLNNLDDLTQLLQNSKNYQKALKVIASQNFVDSEFPSNIESIIGFNQPSPDSFYYSLKWLRPKNFYTLVIKNGIKYATKETTEDYYVYKQINPEDMNQGRLGDCYLLAACGAISQYPHRLERVFISGKHYNPKGLYAIAVCINGIWEEIILDDFFPVFDTNNRPAFSCSKNNSLWMMLLEKAWAKIHSGYLNISCGFTGEALRDFTGAPTQTNFFKDQNFKIDKILNERNQTNWNLLMEGFRKKFIMCTSSKNINNGSDEVDKDLGISGNHAYSILGVYDLGPGTVLYSIISIIYTTVILLK